MSRVDSVMEQRFNGSPHWVPTPNAMNEFGDAPMHEASTWNHVDCAVALIGLGADGSRENQVQEQPILRRALQGRG